MPLGPVLADVDHDGMQEMVVTVGDQVGVFHGDGTLGPGWPQPGGAPSLAELNADGQLEVVINGPDGVRVYRADGTLLWYRSHLDTTRPLARRPSPTLTATAGPKC